MASKVGTIALGIGTTLGAAVFLGYLVPNDWEVYGYLFMALVALCFGWMLGNSAGQDSSEREIDRITAKCDEYLGALRMAAAKFEKAKETAPSEAREVKHAPESRTSEDVQKAQMQARIEAEAPRLYTRDAKGKYRRYEP